MSEALQRLPTQELAPVQPMNLAAITERIMSGELTPEKLAMIERLVAMDAERQFAAAFVALQAEMPKVKAVKSIPNRDGSVRSTFAPYEEIMDQVAPLLLKHKFTVTFSTDFKEGRIIKICTLAHGGHSRSNSFAVRIGSGPPGCSEAQADGAAGTYAKRGALCDCLNIVIDHDVDARAEGGTITAEQAEELERRVSLINGDHKAFLKWALSGREGGKYAEIPATAYAKLDEFLTKKEQ